MRDVATLTWHSLRRFASLLLSTGLILAGFQVLLVEVGAYLYRAQAFSQFALLFPAFVRELMGPSFFAFLSFSGVVCLGYFHIAVMSALIGLMIALGTEPAAEIETGFADLILSKPVARHVPITRTVVVLLISAGLILGLMMAGTLIGLALSTPEGAVRPTPALIRGLVANLGSLLLCWGGIALAAGACARRRATAAAFSGLLAFAAFLVGYLGQLWKPADGVSHISPFRYYNPLGLVVSGRFPSHDIRLLLSVALAGVLVAYFVYARRDL